MTRLLGRWAPPQAGEWTPLYTAIQNGHQRVVQELVNCPRVDIHRATSEGCTALYRAANFGQEDVSRPPYRSNNRHTPAADAT